MLDDIVKEFLVESFENLDQLDKDLMALQDAPDDRSRLSSIFRTIHTIKGTSGFLAFPKLEHITYLGENLLVLLRDGALWLNAEITSGLLSMVDAVRSILGQIDSTGTEGDEAYEVLVATLGRLKNGESSAAAAAIPAAAASEQAEIEVELVIRELSKDIAAAVAASTTKSKKPKGSKAESKAVSVEATRFAVPVPAVMTLKPTVHVS